MAEICVYSLELYELLQEHLTPATNDLNFVGHHPGTSNFLPPLSPIGFHREEKKC